MLLTRSPLSLPLRGNRVRLACVRHAASVDSEPGSNSHVKFAVFPRHLRSSGSQLFNAIADDLALRCCLTLCCKWFLSAVALARSGKTSHSLTLDGLFTSARCSFSRAAMLCESLLCLHALSSFQRTGIRFQPRVTASASSASPPSGRFRPF